MKKITFKHKIKRLIQRSIISMIKSLNTDNREPVDDSEFDASIIFRLTLKDPNSEVLISPRVGKHYIRNEQRKMLLILENESLNIINHVYGYNVNLRTKTYNSLRNLFLIEVEKRRKQMEDEYKDNVRQSLKTIINSIN